MTLKTILAALALTLSPALAIAECSASHERQASSCMDGYTWDGEAGACVEVSTS